MKNLREEKRGEERRREEKRGEERRREEKRGEYFFYWETRGEARNYHFGRENGLFEPKNVTTNTRKLTDVETNNNNDIIINIKQRNVGKKFLIRNINHLRNFIEATKYLILLNLFNNILVNNKISLLEYNSYNITLKIKGTGIKKIFSSDGNFKSDYYPNEVYINRKKKSSVTYNYYLDQTDNFIELIWYNLINSCEHMFCGCSDITEIDLSNFDTSDVTIMQGMFAGCSSLTSINLSNFDTSKVTLMNYMFFGCISLTIINSSNFDTSKVVWMTQMFDGCSSLTSLNLSNFDTSKVELMNQMFEGCSSLTSLNLSNFDTSKVEDISQMFYGCTNLEYINMINFNENSLIKDSAYYSNMFINVPNNIVVCVNQYNIPQIYSQIENKVCYSEDCSNDWKLKQNKFIEGSKECINNCSDINKYEYNGQCVSECQNGYFIDDNGFAKCKCELEKCLTCPSLVLNKELCTKCNDNYYPMENDSLNLGEYFNCYNETPEGYYLDTIDKLYKNCYYTCKTCELKGDNEFHNCLKCNSDFNFSINKNNYINCYVNRSYYDEFDNNNNNSPITEGPSIPSEYPHIIPNTVIENIKLIESLIDDIFNSGTNEENEDSRKEEDEVNKYNEILEKTESVFTSGNYDLTDIDKGEEQVIKANKILITFTNTENQKNNIESNMSTIDLGECEILLRYNYNLTHNETIYMKKIDITQDGTKAKKVEYNVYRKLSSNKLEKLNLTICENTKISINIPYEINGNVDKYNTSSGYFNDICYVATSNDGTDISLQDRKNEYMDGDNIICQDDCDFSEYDYKHKKAKCECYAKDSNSSFADMIINKEQLFKNLKDIRNLLNLNILICYQELLSFISFSRIIRNIGSFIIIGVIIIHIISIFIFYIVQLKIIEKITKDITFGITNMHLIKKNKTKKNTKQKIVKQKKKNKNIKKTKEIRIQPNKVKNKRINNNIILNNNNYINNNIKMTTNNIQIKKANSYRNFLNSKNGIEKKIKKVKTIMSYNNDELNVLSFDLALIYDKRSFCQYYFALLRIKHNLIFSFCNNNDYNPGIIKIDLFFIGFSVYFTVNALFFNDDAMHKIYAKKGKYDLETQIPIAIYSSLISILFNTPLSLLGLPKDRIIQFKQNQTTQGIKKRADELIACLKFKFVLFFIISFLFLLFFWYYITMFGVIYKNTQYHLLKDTLISFVVSLLSPFGIYLLPGFFRIPSLSNRNRRRKCMYNFSKILQLL